MSELDCQKFRDLAAELALNILTGRERGDALRHLDACPSCREEVRQLTSVTDGLIGLIPDAQPPPGFEDRVLAALAPPRKQRTPTAVRVLSVVAAAALLGGELLGSSPRVTPSPDQTSQPGERTVNYAPLLNENRQVGQAYFYPGNPPWIYLSLAAASTPASNSSITCEAIHPDGTTSQLGSFPLNHGHATWAGPAPEPPNNLVAARLVDQTGHTLATARFEPQSPPAPPSSTLPPGSPRHPSSQDVGHDSAPDLDDHGHHDDEASHNPQQANGEHGQTDHRTEQDRQRDTDGDSDRAASRPAQPHTSGDPHFKDGLPGRAGRAHVTIVDFGQSGESSAGQKLETRSREQPATHRGRRNQDLATAAQAAVGGNRHEGHQLRRRATRAPGSPQHNCSDIPTPPVKTAHHRRHTEPVKSWPSSSRSTAAVGRQPPP